MTSSNDDSMNTEEIIANAESSAIAPMQELFMAAMEHRQMGQTKKAEVCLLEILKNEPRLPEPHLELAHIYHATKQLDEARIHIEEAVQYLENGGQWLDLPEQEVLSMAYVIQGDIYRSLADLDEVVFGDQVLYVDYINRAKNAFSKANMIDSSTVEFTGNSRSWQWDQQLEQSINEELSKSQETEPQHEDPHHHSSSSDPKPEE